jgi:hypothetical protein
MTRVSGLPFLNDRDDAIPESATTWLRTWQGSVAIDLGLAEGQALVRELAANRRARGEFRSAG